MSIAQTRQRIATIDWSFAGRITFWMEAMWLGAFALIPVVFGYNRSLVSFEEAKSYALHFFALALFVLLIADAAYKFFSARERGQNVESFDVMEWLRADRANWLLAAVAVFTFIYAISTALSPAPYYSFWGATPSASGYNLYSFLSMMVIFIAVVTHVRSSDQIWRIFYVLAMVGTVTAIYGFFQRYGMDPFQAEDNFRRVGASFGNPIYFGAYLVMSIPATVAIAVDKVIARKPVVSLLALTSVVMQVVALWYTGSRGPLIGLAAAVVVSLITAMFILPRKQTISLMAATVLVIGAAVAMVLIQGDASTARAVRFTGELSALVNNDGSASIQGGLAGRGQIWGEVLDLAEGWDTLPPDTGISKALKPVFGFGPDMLRFSTSLVAKPRSGLEIIDHAHNRLLQVLMELGWAGLLSFLAVAGITTWLLISTIRAMRSGRSEIPTTRLVLLLGVTGGLAGMAVEQMAGVGRVSDLLTSWVLIGLVIILYRSLKGHSSLDTVEEPQPQSVSTRSSRRRRSAAAPAKRELATRGAFGVGVVALIAALIVFGFVDWQMLRASRMTMDAFERVNANDAYPQFEKAQELAPQIEAFTTFPADLLNTGARRLLEDDNRDGAIELAEESYTQLLAYHKRNPLAILTRIKLAETAALLQEIGLREYKQEQLLRYQELEKQFPTSMAVLAVVANSYAAAELYDESIALADHIISLEDVTLPSAQAWWVRGKALEKLERYEEAIASFEGAVERQPEGQFGILSHKDLAALYTKLGDTEAAEFHKAAAEELEAAN